MAQEWKPPTEPINQDWTPPTKPVANRVASPIPLRTEVGSNDPTSPAARFELPANVKSSKTQPIRQQPLTATQGRPSRPETSLSDTPKEPGLFDAVLAGLETGANPKSWGDIGNLLIPSGVEQALKYGSGLLNRYKINVKAADEVVKAAGDIELPKPKINPADVMTTKPIESVPKAAEETALQNMRDSLPKGPTGQPITNPAGHMVDDINDLPIMKGEVQKPNELPLQAGETSLSQTVNDRMKQALKESVPLRKEQEKIYKQQAGERIARFGESKAQGHEYIGEFKKAMSGEMPKVGAAEPLGNKLSEDDFKELVEQIKSAPSLDKFQRGRTGIALEKLWNGTAVPQENEIALLRQVFGDDIGDLIKPVRGFKSLAGKAVDFSKEMTASADISAPFRQGLGAIHKKEFWTSLDDMLGSLGSENFFQGLQKNIKQSEHYGLGQDVGLFISDLKSVSAREERFRSSLAEHLPLGVGKVVRASNRAYTGFLNKLRSDLFESLVNQAIKAGRDPRKDLNLAEEIAGYVNTATGRGSLGSLEKYADGMNTVLFSPKFIASRVNMLNPATYIKADPFVRKEYIKSLLAIGAAGTMVTELGRLAGGKISNDPKSSDFRKVRIGNTRIDPNGGFQQYVTLASRLASWAYTNSKGKTKEYGSGYGVDTARDAIFDFAANKLSPPAAFVNDWLDQTKYRGFSYPEHIINLVTPMMIQDIYSVIQEDPELLPVTVPASAVGFGVQSYK